jgi:hypothetical protein
MSNGPVVRGDELIDLDTMEVLDAHSPGMPLDEFRQLVRGIRSKEEGLLIVYPISPDSIGSTKGKNCENTIGSVLFRSSLPSTIIGLAVVFPNSDCEITEFWQGSAGKSDEH